MHENCDRCNKDYNFTTDNAKLVLYLNYLQASHVEAKCSNCGQVEIIYVTTQAFLHIYQECKLGILMGYDPPDERRAACDAIFEEFNSKDEVVHTSEPPPEVDVPNWMLRQLYDDLREFGGQS